MRIETVLVWSDNEILNRKKKYLFYDVHQFVYCGFLNPDVVAMYDYVLCIILETARFAWN